MKRFTKRSLWQISLLTALAVIVSTTVAAQEPARTRLAFGSCIMQAIPQPIWPSILAYQPQVFVFLGDNIYAATEDMNLMRAEYGRLEAQPGFRQLRSTATVLATWDDNDYGAEDGGADYPKRVESKQLFLDFWKVPPGDARWHHGGVYSSWSSGEEPRKLQIILLDTRFFRSPLKTNHFPAPHHGPYLPTNDPKLTMLGDEQWTWLDGELRRPADIRIIVSSIQVLADEHGFESWGNLPAEREKLFRLVHDAQASGVIFISGDRHHAELTRRPGVLPYAAYDLTSSSLTMDRPDGQEQNSNRVGAQYLQKNFGSIEIDWEARQLRLQIRDVGGALQADTAVPFSELHS